MIKITKDETRKYLFNYQNLYNPRKLESDEDILNFIRKVGCIQYDPLKTVARNADLVLQSRCKNYSEHTPYHLLYEKRQLLDGWDKNSLYFCSSSDIRRGTAMIRSMIFDLDGTLADITRSWSDLKTE